MLKFSEKQSMKKKISNVKIKNVCLTLMSMADFFFSSFFSWIIKKCLLSTSLMRFLGISLFIGFWFVYFLESCFFFVEMSNFWKMKKNLFFFNVFFRSSTELTFSIQSSIECSVFSIFYLFRKKIIFSFKFFFFLANFFFPSKFRPGIGFLN